MDQKTLKQHLHYEPLTGLFTWIKTTGKVLKGSRAGYIHKHRGGYINIGFKGKNLKAHRLAFLYMTGSIPKFIDHKDRDRSNNKWNNLKGTTITGNNKNCSAQKNNTSGTMGVSWSKKKRCWVAQIGYKRKTIPLGCFTDKQKAIDARKKAEKHYDYSLGHGQQKEKLNQFISTSAHQKSIIAAKALKDYLNGTTVQILAEKYEVSKRLFYWMEDYAKKTDQFLLFKAEQNRQRRVAGKKAGLPQRQKVQQIATTGTVINTYSSMIEAAQATGINQGNISNVCAGRQKTSGGFKWQLV